MRRLRGLFDLVFDAVEGTTDLVERTHDAVVESSARRFSTVRPVRGAARIATGIQTAISGGLFGTVRAINGVTRITVNAVADVAEAGLVRSSVPDERPGKSTAADSANRYVDTLQSLLNGFWGDNLSRRRSELDLGMTVRHEGRDLPATPEAVATAYPNATGKVCVFVHGLGANEWLWGLSSEKHYGDPDVTFGTRLRDDLGFTPVYLRYNTGRHVSENGRALATLLTELLNVYPVAIEEIAIVGHSMGGLVARSAAHYGREHGQPWVAHLQHVACLGSPHLGAPLEKTVNLLAGALGNVRSAGAQVPAELLASRSAGVKDLRHGYTVDEEWAGKDPDEMFADFRRNLPAVDGVGYHFLAATISRDPDHPLGRLLGDLLVRLPSAFGEASEPARRIHFSSVALFPGMNHMRLANHPVVYEALRALLAA